MSNILCLEDSVQPTLTSRQGFYKHRWADYRIYIERQKNSIAKIKCTYKKKKKNKVGGLVNFKTDNKARVIKIV